MHRHPQELRLHSNGCLCLFTARSIALSDSLAIFGCTLVSCESTDALWSWNLCHLATLYNWSGSSQMLQVGALSELKKDMATWQSLLQGRLVEEVEEALYVLKVCCPACMPFLSCICYSLQDENATLMQDTRDGQSTDEEDSDRARLPPSTLQGQSCSGTSCELACCQQHVLV